MFFFILNINPKILSQLAEVLFDPAVFILVINMSGANLTNLLCSNQDSENYHNVNKEMSDSPGQLQLHIIYNLEVKGSLLTIRQLE